MNSLIHFLRSIFKKEKQTDTSFSPSAFASLAEYNSFKRIYFPYIAAILLFVGVGVTVYQVQQQQEHRGRAATTPNAPIGAFDQIETNNWIAYGWALDRDVINQPIFVDLYVDNPAGVGVAIGRFLADKNRPDLAGAGFPTNHGFEIPIPAKYRIGFRKFYAYAIDPSGSGQNPLLGNAPKTIGTKPSGNAQISSLVDGSQAVITTTERLAGAIHSFTWKGKEFVDSVDHGRQIQSSAFVDIDVWSGCINPTEAGGEYDGTGSNTTSVLQRLENYGNRLVTQTQMAYWAQANIPYNHPSCGTKGIVNPPYPSNLSNYIMEKDIIFGFQGNNHIIDYKTTWHIPDNQPVPGIGLPYIWEAPTNYMPRSTFNTTWTYEPSTKTLTQQPTGIQGERGTPIIVSSTDQQWAMSVYSPWITQQNNPPNKGYKIFDLISDNVVSAGCIYRGILTAGADLNFRCFAIFGTMQDVKNGIDQVYTHFIGPTPTPDIECTQDIFTCPDGTRVGRVPPACNFAPCPIVPTATPIPTPIPTSTPIPPTPTRTPTPQPTNTPIPPTAIPTQVVKKPGDVNGDGFINSLDLNEIVINFNRTGIGMPADLNNDGIVNALDFNEVVANYGR